MARVVALVSGGIKSAVAAACHAAEHELLLLHVDFGQPAHPAEQRAVQTLAAALPKARVISISLNYLSVLRDNSTSSAPAASRNAASSKAAHRSETAAVRAGAVPAAPRPVQASAVSLRGIVPVLFSVAGHVAAQCGTRLVIAGFSREVDDTMLGHAWWEPEPQTRSEGETDRRRAFVHAFDMAEEMALSSRARIRYECPLSEVAYVDVVQLAYRFQLPVEQLWSCERSDNRPCLQCGPCTARSRAFTDAHRPVPTPQRQAST